MLGCSDDHPPTDNRASPDKASPSMTLKSMPSGYRGDVAGMTRFLQCWREEMGLPAPQPDPSRKAAGTPAFDSRLPKSARDFFAARGEADFESLYEAKTGRQDRFADPAILLTFREHSATDYANWEAAWVGIDPPDAEYYRYNRDQSPFRSRDLPKFLVVGHEAGGAFYLLNPDEKTADGETEILFLHHGGLVYRVRSFAHLLANLYLEERERAAGRDASLGNLYYFDKPLADTCVRHIIDL